MHSLVHNDSAGVPLPLRLASEDRLALVCARQQLTDAVQDELDHLLREPLRWDRVLELASWQKLSGLFYRHLKSPSYAGLVPQEALWRLKEQYLRNTARQLYYQTELGRIVAALADDEIPVIVLKGAALIQDVYRGPGLRPMADLDLLVPNELVHRAQALVSGLGYRPGGSPADHEDTEANHRHLPVLIGVSKPVVVEIHRHIVRLDSPLHFDISGFWSRAEEVTIEGCPVKVLSTQDLLLHLCVNFFLDRRFSSFRALAQLCDVAEVARYYHDVITWPDLVTAGRAYGLGGPAACVLFLARNLLDAPVPVGTIDALWPTGLDTGQLAAFTRRRVLSTGNWVAKDLVQPGSTYGKASVVRAMLRRLWPSRRYMTSHYGAPATGPAGLKAYGRRLAEGVGILLRAAARPSALWEDLSIDRWHHSLSGGNNGASGAAQSAKAVPADSTMPRDTTLERSP